MGFIRWIIGIRPKENFSPEERKEEEKNYQKWLEDEKERNFIKLYKKLEKRMSFKEIAINLMLQGGKKGDNIYDHHWLLWYLKEIQDYEKIKQYEEIEYQIVLKALPRYYEDLEKKLEKSMSFKHDKRTKEEWMYAFKNCSFPRIEELIEKPENILKYRWEIRRGLILDKYLKYDWEEIQKGNPLIKEAERQRKEKEIKKELKNEQTELELKKALAEKEKEILELQLKLQQQVNNKVR